jgi:hypothetical protein
MPDFVFEPVVQTTGSGHREVGDGLIVSGQVGIMMQPKSRGTPSTTAEREHRWPDKNIAKGFCQGEEPPSSGETQAHLMLRIIFEDIARTELPSPGDALDMAAVLSHLDTIPLPARADFGARMLQAMDRAFNTRAMGC